MTTRHAVLATQLGELTAVVDRAHATGEGAVVVGLYFPGHWTLPEPDAFGEPVTASAARTASPEPTNSKPNCSNW